MRQPVDSRGLLATMLIGLGLLLLLLRYFGGLAGTMWPFFVILPGVALVVVGTSASWKSSYVAAAGAVLTGIGVILAVQNAAHYYQSWAYAWALLPAFAGAAIWMMGARDNDNEAKVQGRGLMQWGLVVFVVLAAMFELFIFNRGWFDAGLMLALLLIVTGGFLLFYRVGEHASGSNTSSDKPPAPR